MSESKQVAPSSDAKAGGRLSDKAPPKPRRHGSSIPAALVASKPAAKIRPAPPPPRPVLKSAPAAELALEDFPSLRRPVGESERPVATSVPAASRKPGAAPRRLAPLALVAAAALGGVIWYGQQAPSGNQPAPLAHNPVAAARHADSPQAAVAQSGTTEPEDMAAVRTIDLDEVEADGSAVNAADVPTTADAPNERVGETARASDSKRDQQAGATPDERAQLDSTAAAREENLPPAGAEVGSAPAASPGGEGEPVAGEQPVTDTATPTALPAFDAEAAKLAISASATQASSCRRGDDPRGTAEVLITFAPSGRVTSANVTGAPYGGTQTGGCIAETLRGAVVPAFSGEHVTVRKLVKVR